MSITDMKSLDDRRKKYAERKMEYETVTGLSFGQLKRKFKRTENRLVWKRQKSAGKQGIK